jgi:hypothetical protein
MRAMCGKESLNIFVNACVVVDLDDWQVLGVQVLLQGNAELLAQGLELSEVLLVLALVLNLGLDTCSWGEVS